MTTSGSEVHSERRSRVRLSAFLIGIGTVHFLRPTYFDRIVPNWVPGRARFWTYASGVAEITSGALLASPKTKRIGGYAAAATIAAVYPANVQMAIDNPPKTALGVASWLRLPMQFPMIAWALRQTRAHA
jgi:uncharacterized membrane protein